MFSLIRRALIKERSLNKLFDKVDQLEKRYFEGNLNPKKKRDYEVSIVDIPKK